MAKTDPRAQLALFFRAGFKSNGARWERRLYKRLWARVRRLDPKFRDAEAERMREQSHEPRVKKADARRHAVWARKHRRRLRSYNRRYHLEHRMRRCGFCGRRAGRGRYCLRPVRGKLACPVCFA